MKAVTRASVAAETSGRLNGKTAIVTGARRSIGRAIAVALAGERAQIVVHYRSQRDQADATVEALRSNGTDAIAVGGDLTDSGAVAALFDETHTHFGGVDIVVANAGATTPLTPVADISDKLFDSLLNANTRATFYVLRQAAQAVRDGGRIINISSSSVRFPAAGFAAYATSKSGALTTIGILATELGGREITANSIMAGVIAAGFLDPSDGSVLAAVADVPVGGGVVLTDRDVVVTQPVSGTFKAFSATCTHQGCAVSEVANGTINCPCHGRRFAVADGSVTAGPATTPLPEKTVAVHDNAVVLS